MHIGLLIYKVQISTKARQMMGRPVFGLALVVPKFAPFPVLSCFCGVKICAFLIVMFHPLVLQEVLLRTTCLVWRYNLT